VKGLVNGLVNGPVNGLVNGLVKWSGEWSSETLLDFLQCRSWSFTIFEYNINISTLVYVSFNGICYNNRVGWNGVRPIAIYDDSFVWLFILRR
jgi:hypothetical protein